MAFLIKNASDNSIVHQNRMTTTDFNEQDLNESEWIDVSLPFSTMKIKQWVFDGIRMAYTDWTFKKPISFDWNSDFEVITMYYSLKGSVSIGSDINNTFVLGNNHKNIFYGTEASGFMKVDELRMKSFMVQFNKEAFLRIASGGTDALKDFADKVASKKTSSFSEKGLLVDVNTQNVVDAILNCKFSNSLKKVFFLSKAMELLVLQAEAHTKSLNNNISYVKTDYDKDRIIFAKDYLLQHIDTPPTISELSKIAGINEFKLKKGYKEIFGTTIFGHLAEVRLQLAKDALIGQKIGF